MTVTLFGNGIITGVISSDEVTLEEGVLPCKKRRETQGGEDPVRSEAAWSDAAVAQQGWLATARSWQRPGSALPASLGENLALPIS